MFPVILSVLSITVLLDSRTALKLLVTIGPYMISAILMQTGLLVVYMICHNSNSPPDAWPFSKSSFTLFICNSVIAVMVVLLA